METQTDIENREKKEKKKYYIGDLLIIIFCLTFLVVGTYYLVTDGVNENYPVVVYFYLANIFYIVYIILYNLNIRNWWLNIAAIGLLIVWAILFIYLTSTTYYKTNRMIINIFIIEIFIVIMLFVLLTFYSLICNFK